MPVVPNPLEQEALARAREEDKPILYLVVRDDVELPFADLVDAAARATVLCAESYRDEPRFQEAFEDWQAGSYGKVALRAKAREIARLKEEFQGAVASAEVGGEVVALAFPPRRKSEREQALKRLQVYRPARPELDFAVPEGALERRALVVFNGALSLGAGKALAQAAHGALMLADSPLGEDPAYVERFRAWREAGYRFFVVEASAVEFARLKAEQVYHLVRDAGLTEVARGSETVLVLPPGARL